MIGIPGPECVCFLSNIELPGRQQHVLLQNHLSQSPGRHLSYVFPFYEASQKSQEQLKLLVMQFVHQCLATLCR